MSTVNTVKPQPPSCAQFQLDLSISMQRNNIFLREMSKGKSQLELKAGKCPDRQVLTCLSRQSQRQDGEQTQERGASGKNQAGQQQLKRAHLSTDSEQYKKAFELPTISLSSSLSMVILDIIQSFSKAGSIVSLPFLPLSQLLLHRTLFYCQAEAEGGGWGKWEVYKVKHRLNHVPLSFEHFIPVACGEQVALYPRTASNWCSEVWNTERLEQYWLLNQTNSHSCEE